MIRRTRLFLLVLAVAATAAAAAPIEHDLGAGLVYVRVHRLPADLPAQPAGRAAPCVIDLRYVAADDAEAAAFAAWLKFRAAPKTPVFVLANAGTSAALRQALAGRERGAGVMVIGPESEQLRPDVAVKTSAAAERRAYEAREKGAALTALLADHPHKVRNDEASLLRESQARPLPEEPAENGAEEKPEPAPVDATLQRAVHLHRALVALKKL